MKRILKFIIGALILSGSVLAQTTITACPVFTRSCNAHNGLSQWSNGDLEKIGRILTQNGSGGGGSTTVNSPTIVANYYEKKHYIVPTTAGSYTTGQSIGGSISINDLKRGAGLPVRITDVSVIDKTGRTPDIIIDFFLNSTTIADGSTGLNGLTSSPFAGQYAGSIKILAADWVTTGVFSRFTICTTGIILNNDTEWIVNISALGSVTYGVNSLEIKIGVAQD